MVEALRGISGCSEDIPWVFLTTESDSQHFSTTKIGEMQQITAGQIPTCTTLPYGFVLLNKNKTI